jgi:thiamine pyrophosphate-dependent acetolactate synthase large subunit-like protein
MLGYQILAEALAKQNLEHCYGIVGMSFFIQEFRS